MLPIDYWHKVNGDVHIMAANSTFENKAILKDGLMKQIKAYRNISIKSGLLLFLITFSSHYALASYDAEPIGFLVLETLYKSFTFAIAFALVGYCVGSVWGAHLQRQKITSISDERTRRRNMLEEQIALRQSKLDQFSGQ